MKKKIVMWFHNNRIMQYLSKKIYRELFGTLFLGLILSIGVYIAMFYGCISLGLFRQEHVSYERNRVNISNEILEKVENLYQFEDSKRYQQELESLVYHMDGTAYLSDEDGKVLLVSQDNTSAASQIDLKAFRKKVQSENRNNQLVGMYPITTQTNRYYLLYTIELRPDYSYTNEYIYLISAIVASIVFFLLTFFSIRKKINYIRYLGSSAGEISNGNLDVKVDVQGCDEISLIAGNMNLMIDSLNRKIQAERKQYEDQQELITNMSHYLKTPITVLLGYLDILRTHQYKEEDDLQKFLEISYDKAESLRVMVLKLFELTKNTKGNELELADVNLSRLLRQLVMEQEPLAGEKDVTIAINLPKEPVIVRLDLNRMTGALDNLMNNAIKYVSRQGKIHIELEESNSELFLEFSNTSPILSDEKLKNIFKKFYRADKARNSAIEGNGIGLAIVKEVIELHQGTIHASYADGEIHFKIRLQK